MARVRPFAGIRYAQTGRDITPLDRPPILMSSPKRSATHF